LKLSVQNYSDSKLSIFLLDKSIVVSNSFADVVSSDHQVRLGINWDRHQDRLQDASEFVASGKNQPRGVSVKFSREVKQTFLPHCRLWTSGDRKSTTTGTGLTKYSVQYTCNTRTSRGRGLIILFGYDRNASTFPSVRK